MPLQIRLSSSNPITPTILGFEPSSLWLLDHEQEHVRHGSTWFLIFDRMSVDERAWRELEWCQISRHAAKTNVRYADCHSRHPRPGTHPLVEVDHCSLFTAEWPGFKKGDLGDSDQLRLAHRHRRFQRSLESVRSFAPSCLVVRKLPDESAIQLRSRRTRTEVTRL